MELVSKSFPPGISNNIKSPDETFRYPWILFELRYFDRWLKNKSLTHKQLVGDYCQGLIKLDLSIKLVYDRSEKKYCIFYNVKKRINPIKMSEEIYRVKEIFQEKKKCILKILKIIEDYKPRNRYFLYKYICSPNWDGLKDDGRDGYKIIAFDTENIDTFIESALHYDLTYLEKNIKKIGPLLYNVGYNSLKNNINYIMIN